MPNDAANWGIAAGLIWRTLFPYFLKLRKDKEKFNLGYVGHALVSAIVTAPTMNLAVHPSGNAWVDFAMGFLLAHTLQDTSIKVGKFFKKK